MNTTTINFKVTPEEETTIRSRMIENGFDEISAYLKVIALKTQAFALLQTGTFASDADVELEFQVSEGQKKIILEKMKENKCEDLDMYCKYVALHSIVSATVEVRSTGDIDDMLKRITDSRRKVKLNPLFK
ncbi:MAG: hypothetical protein Q9M32_02660 [Sulfurimonas sp.]|nr:hypothetical protein [Sulfurimonas sp.]MDQ7062450.1 hypothetical protein [Sulfurimonas sp.]